MQANRLIVKVFIVFLFLSNLFQRLLDAQKLNWKRLVANWAKAKGGIGQNLALEPPALNHLTHFPKFLKISDFYTDMRILDLRVCWKMLIWVDLAGSHVTLSAGGSSGSGKAAPAGTGSRELEPTHQPTPGLENQTDTRQPPLLRISSTICPQFVPLWQPILNTECGTFLLIVVSFDQSW